MNSFQNETLSYLRKGHFCHKATDKDIRIIIFFGYKDLEYELRLFRRENGKYK